MHKSMIEPEAEQIRKAEFEIDPDNAYSHAKETLASLPSMLNEVAGYATPLRWYAEMGG